MSFKGIGRLLLNETLETFRGVFSGIVGLMVGYYIIIGIAIMVGVI